MLTRSIRLNLTLVNCIFTKHGYETRLCDGTKNPRIPHVGKTNNELHLIAVEKISGGRAKLEFIPVRW